ncbi:hypothetical protein ACO0LD_14510 [Undibacterium sp. Ji83W]|uniref:hypothetical protein n=1 Tax=Undibacterium sp. Ji83W TaxID=3413043 RepID=UPI003BF44FCA
MKIRFKDKNFLLSKISISLMTFYLCGCAATSEYKVSLPSMDDFSSQEVAFNIGGDRLAIEKKIQSFFAQRTQPTIVYQSKSKSYILTGYFGSNGLHTESWCRCFGACLRNLELQIMMNIPRTRCSEDSQLGHQTTVGILEH